MTRLLEEDVEAMDSPKDEFADIVLEDTAGPSSHVHPVKAGTPGRRRASSASSATGKIWRCEVDGCSKVFKNFNGLKYHQSKG